MSQTSWSARETRRDGHNSPNFLFRVPSNYIKTICEKWRLLQSLTPPCIPRTHLESVPARQRKRVVKKSLNLRDCLHVENDTFIATPPSQVPSLAYNSEDSRLTRKLSHELSEDFHETTNDSLLASASASLIQKATQFCPPPRALPSTALLSTPLKPEFARTITSS